MGHSYALGEREGTLGQVNELTTGKTDGDPSSRQAISSRRVSTASPASSRSIICSIVKPACSPAMASLPIALTNEAFAISHPTWLEFWRESHEFRFGNVTFATARRDRNHNWGF